MPGYARPAPLWIAAASEPPSSISSSLFFFAGGEALRVSGANPSFAGLSAMASYSAASSRRASDTSASLTSRATILECRARARGAPVVPLHSIYAGMSRTTSVNLPELIS